jgi:GcrA cell cycle regulator
MSRDRKTEIIKSLWERGDTVVDIAEAVGLTRSVTQKRLNRAGLRRIEGREIPVLDWTKSKVEELHARWKLGETGTTIAKALGTTRSAVMGKLSREGLKRDELWTAAATTQLRELYAKGKSSGEIATAMGISRSGVNNKIIRLGLRPPGKRFVPKSIVSETLKTLHTRIKRKVEQKTIVNPVAVEPPKNTPGQLIGIMDLTYTTCRWPEGDPKDADFGYCGKHVEHDPAPKARNSVYCTKHHRKAHNLQSGSTGSADAKKAA